MESLPDGVVVTDAERDTAPTAPTALVASLRLPDLTTVRVREGVDSAAVRRELLERHGIEIGAGAGAYATSVWRIGLMGHNSRPDAALLVLAALQDVLSRA